MQVSSSSFVGYEDSPRPVAKQCQAGRVYARQSAPENAGCVYLCQITSWRSRDGFSAGGCNSEDQTIATRSQVTRRDKEDIASVGHWISASASQTSSPCTLLRYWNCAPDCQLSVYAAPLLELRAGLPALRMDALLKATVVELALGLQVSWSVLFNWKHWQLLEEAGMVNM